MEEVVGNDIKPDRYIIQSWPISIYSILSIRPPYWSRNIPHLIHDVIIISRRIAFLEWDILKFRPNMILYPNQSSQDNRKSIQNEMSAADHQQCLPRRCEQQKDHRVQEHMNKARNGSFRLIQRHVVTLNYEVSEYMTK